MKRLFVFAIICFSLICSCEAEKPKLGIDTFPVVFDATRESLGTSTKTVKLDDGSVWWGAAEEISVFYGAGEKGGNLFVSQNENIAEAVKFSGSIQMSGEREDFWAIYPYSEENSCDGKSVVTVIPSDQIGVAGNFSNNVFPTVAKSNAFEFAFWNICGGLKFSLSKAGIKRVKIRGNRGEALAGKVKIVLDDNGKPLVEEVLEPQTEVSLSLPDGESFEPGKDYYLTLLPCQLEEGFTITFERSATIGEFTSIKPQAVKRSVLGVLNTVDKNVDIWNPADESFAGFTGLCFEAVQDGTITIKNTFELTIQYNRGDGWTESKSAEIAIPVSAGDIVGFRGDNDAYGSGNGYTTFSCSSDCYVYGNVMSLISSERFESLNSIIGAFAFCRLFYGNTHLLNHPNKTIVLPATELAEDCYLEMFRGCTGLSFCPVLPSTKMARACYAKMFQECTSLTSCPKLPATELAKSCYFRMFSDCGNLTSCPELPATELAESCYNEMFQECTSLTSCPELPATELTESCYHRMFYKCSSITSCPELPATIIARKCYSEMFYGCRNLTSCPALPATELAESCYYRMFDGCGRLTSCPELPATELAESCYKEMFYACRSLTSCPELPATELAESCYNGMFRRCTSLTSCPELPATTVLYNTCYCEMFRECKSLESTSALSFISYGMFSSCSKLSSTEILLGCSEVSICAFESTALSEIIIPQSVESIRSEAFANSQLRHIKMLPTIPPSLDEDAFESCPLQSIEVPAVAYDDYVANAQWSKYQNIIKIIE